MTPSPMPPPWPRWIADLHRLLGIRPQFILSGPIRDLFLTPLDGQTVLLPILDCLWEALAIHGYQFLLVYDRIDGMRIHPHTPATRQLASRILNRGSTPKTAKFFKLFIINILSVASKN